MNKGEIIELEITKLVYGGEGIGRYDDMTVFVSDTTPGDIVKAELISVKNNYAKAILKEVIKPSEQRIKPFCPLSNACGGCQWQYINYEEQLRAKKVIVEECLKKIAGTEIPVKDTISSSETKNYRCKIQFPVQQTKVSKRFVAGYYKKGTHDLVNIKYCPAQPEIIDEITAFLREKAAELNLTAYNERNKKGLIRHFVFRYSKTAQDVVLTIVINAEKTPENLIKLCDSVKEKFQQVVGVVVNFNTSHTNLIMGKNSQLIHGRDYIEEMLDSKIFKISHDAFFQVNPLTASKIFNEVREIVKQRVNNPSILDIYSGSGSFSIYLSDLASEIVAVEEIESAINDGKENILKNNIQNIHYINENADTAVPKLAAEGKKFDVIILDPPRKGCSKEVLEAVKQLADKFVIYISCDPSTLARDYKILSDKFTAEFVQPVDMFCHTYHVESILVARAKD
ncbi:MAG: 23S rRNA (uracil-5-)-methyltransferase RumA [Candidatus Melainabacteria bacterium GWF2_37_15]|nr:MAG: 23S rRNA (uracil-5-)-methyltransferase RumA [Candidatus Melainabacteria bacterium GWF2_37_15]